MTIHHILQQIQLLYTDANESINPAKRQNKDSLKKIQHLIKSQSIFKSASELIWSLIHGIYERPICEVCGGETKFIGVKNGFRSTCSVKCSANNKKVKDKIKSTCISRYGCHFTQTQEHKQLLISRYGIKPGSFGTQEHKNKIFEKYGVDNVFKSDKIKDKIKKTLMDRYGVDNPQRCARIQSQTKNTNLIRYGVEYPIQNSAIFDKCMRNQLQSRYKLKTMTLPSGKIISYQGYENYVIKYLLESEIDENDLALERTNIPVITYDFDGKQHRYYPDIFVKSKNMLIEVKSVYTFDREIDKNFSKQRASKEAGFHHIIIVWDIKNNCILEIY